MATTAAAKVEAELIQADKVRAAAAELVAFAEANYEKNGWDILVETYSLDDIVAVLTPKRITTLLGARRVFGPRLRTVADVRADIQSA